MRDIKLQDMLWTTYAMWGKQLSSSEQEEEDEEDSDDESSSSDEDHSSANRLAEPP